MFFASFAQINRELKSVHNHGPIFFEFTRVQKFGFDIGAALRKRRANSHTTNRWAHATQIAARGKETTVGWRRHLLSQLGSYFAWASRRCPGSDVDSELMFRLVS